MKNNTIEAKAKEWRKEVELSFTKRIAIIKKYKLLSDEEFDERVIEIYLKENPEVKQDEMAKSAIDFVRDVFIDDPDFRMADWPMVINEDATVAAVHNAMVWQKQQSETKTKEFLDLLALLKQGNFCSVIGDEYIDEILAKHQEKK